MSTLNFALYNQLILQLLNDFFIHILNVKLLCQMELACLGTVVVGKKQMSHLMSILVLYASSLPKRSYQPQKMTSL